MAKKAFFKGEKFIFSRVKGNAETDYREGDINITPTNIGLGSVTNTSDKDKPVSTAQQKAIDIAYANSNKYTDQKIASLINGAPETMDTLKEVADAISASKTTEEALNKAIGTKANQSELDTHTGNDTIHITASERAKWNNQGVTGIRGSAETNYKTGQVTISKDNIGLGNVDNTKDSSKTVYAAQRMTIQDNGIDGNSESFEFHPEYSAEHLGTTFDIVGYNKTNRIMTYGSSVDTIDTRYASTTFTSNDSTTGDSTPPALLASGETHASIFSKVSTLFKNVRWLLSKMGTTDISQVGDGTVTGALSTLNSNITDTNGKYIVGSFVIKANEKATSPTIPDKYNGLRLYYYDGNNGLRQSVTTPIITCNIPYMTANGIKYVKMSVNENRTITFSNDNSINLVITHMYAIVI